MRLTQLQYFVKTAEFGSVNIAAKSLHVTQPAISTAIKNLEEELGTALFIRDRQRLELSPTGSVFYHRILNILQELDYAVDEVHGLTGEQEVLHFGIPPMIGTFCVPAILKQFVPKHPEIQIKMEEANTRELSTLLHEGKLDFALMIGESPYSRGFNRRKLIDTQYSFFVGEQNKLAHRSDTLSIQDVAKEPLMLFDTGLYLNQYITDAFYKRNMPEPKIVFASSQINSIKHYVSQGLGGTFLIRECVNPEDGLVELQTEITPDISIIVTWPKGVNQKNAARALIKFLESLWK